MKFNAGDKVVAYGSPIQGLERSNPKGYVGTIVEGPSAGVLYKVRFTGFNDIYGFTLVYHKKQLRKYKT